jgi:hypothetical protein
MTISDLAKRDFVERMMKEIKDETGFPVWVKLSIETEDGKKQDVYKREALFDAGDYKRVVEYWRQQKEHAAAMERGYIVRARVKFPELESENGRRENRANSRGPNESLS